MPFRARSECCWGSGNEEGCGIFFPSSKAEGLPRTGVWGRGKDGTGQGSIKQFREYHNFSGYVSGTGCHTKQLRSNQRDELLWLGKSYRDWLDTDTEN